MDLNISGVGLQRAKSAREKFHTAVPASGPLSSSVSVEGGVRGVQSAGAATQRSATGAVGTAARTSSPSAEKRSLKPTRIAPGARTRPPQTQSTSDAALEGCLVENLKRQIRLLEQHVALLKNNERAPQAATSPCATAACAGRDDEAAESSPLPHNAESEKATQRPLTDDEQTLTNVPAFLKPLTSTALQRAMTPEPYHMEMAALEVNLRAVMAECCGLQDMCLSLNREKEVMRQEIVELRAALRQEEQATRSAEVVRDAALDQLGQEQRARLAAEQMCQSKHSAPSSHPPPPSLEDITYQRDFYKIQSERLRALTAQQTAQLGLVERALAQERESAKAGEEQLCRCLDRVDMLETLSRAAHAYYTTLSQRFVVLSSVVRKMTESQSDTEGVSQALAEVTAWEENLKAAPPLGVHSAPESDEEAVQAPFEGTDAPLPSRHLAPPDSVEAEVAHEGQQPHERGQQSPAASEEVAVALDQPALPDTHHCPISPPPSDVSAVRIEAVVPAPPEARAMEDAPDASGTKATAEGQGKTGVPAEPNHGEPDAAVPAPAGEETPAQPEAPLSEIPCAVVPVPPPPPPASVESCLLLPPAPPVVAVPPPPPGVGAPPLPPPPTSAVPPPPMTVVPVPAASVPAPSGVPHPPAPPTLKERLSELDARAAEEEQALASYVNQHMAEQ